MDLWRESCIWARPGPAACCPWVLWISYWLDATEADWLYGGYCAIGLALPDWGKFPLGRRISVRIMLGGGVGAVGGITGKYALRPPMGGVGKADCDVTISDGRVFAVRNGD
jgi:hypothetical protein